MKNLEQLLNVIRTETQPINGHPDPKALDDCWNEVFEQLADRDATIAEMREALEVLNDASKRVHNTHNGHVACTAKNCAAKDVLIKAEAILAKYPQKGK